MCQGPQESGKLLKIWGYSLNAQVSFDIDPSSTGAACGIARHSVTKFVSRTRTLITLSQPLPS
jgi:hypothetical protein